MKLILIYIGMMACCFTANSQDSLMNYLEMAARNNPTVLQRYADYETALQKVPQVGSLPDPELSLGVFLSPMELVSGNQVADIRLMQMFPWFGVLKNAKDEMSLMAKAKYETFRDAKLQLFFDVQRTWYKLNKVEQNIRISEKNLDLLRTIERLSVVRFKAGASGSGSGLSDVYRIQIEISDLQNDIEWLKSQRTTLFAQFNAYLNRPQTLPVSLTDSMALERFDPAMLTLSDSSLNNNPMLGMLRFEQQSLEARKLMVTKMGYPMVGVGLNYSLIGKSDMSTSPMNGSDMVMPMVTITLPIYRKKYKAKQAEVELEKAANKQNYQATANALQTEYFQAVQLQRDAKRRINLYAGQNQLASKSLDILLKSYSSSGANLTDLLRVQQQLLDYELQQVEAIADYNTSVAWIKRLLAYSQNQ